MRKVKVKATNGIESVEYDGYFHAWTSDGRAIIESCIGVCDKEKMETIIFLEAPPMGDSDKFPDDKRHYHGSSRRTIAK